MNHPPRPPRPRRLRQRPRSLSSMCFYGEWITALEVVQEAHTAVWARRWAGDKVTNARGDRLRGLRDLRLRMRSSLTNDGTPYAASRKYEGVARSANFRQIMIREAGTVGKLRFHIACHDGGDEAVHVGSEPEGLAHESAMATSACSREMSGRGRDV